MNEKKQGAKKAGKGADQPFEKQRRQFRQLLLTNPNYFGNLKACPFEPEIEIKGDTHYEEIGCVGFQPQFNRLEAVVYVKQPTGYGGDICSAGTPEYVRFYLSFDGGATWHDQGMSVFTSYDIPEGTEGRDRLEYAAAIDVSPSKKWCTVDNMIQARAILSWNIAPPPGDPNYDPVWGNVHDTHILVDPFKLKIAVGELFEAVELELEPQLAQWIDPKEEVGLVAPKKLSLVELQDLYRGKDVEPHRFGMPGIHKMLAEPGLGEAILASPQGPLADFKVDLSDLFEQLQPGDGDVRYEEMECVGLDTVRDELVAVIRVKLPNGYSGGPCSAGSTEYVTFWGDFDLNGTFEQCLGTAAVQVYDIEEIPKEGLEYAVFLPVNLHPFRQACGQGPRLARIRAILSWEVIPPCGDPNFVPRWGNREETLIHIRPGTPIEEGDYTPFLYSICNRDVCSIDQASGWTGGDKPFGGVVNIAGEIPSAMTLSIADTLKYKVYVRPLDDLGNPIGGGSWQPLGNSFTVTIQQGTGPTTAISYPLLQEIDPSDGFYTYREHGAPIGPWRRVISPNRLLAHWTTSAAEAGLWEIRIEALDTLTNTLYLAGVTTCLVDGSTRQNVKVRLDQTAPVATIGITGYSRDGGPVQPALDCDTFQVGDVIHGDYSATDPPDDHFRVLTLTLEPTAAAHGAAVSPASSSYPAVAGAGETGSWTLDTTGMDPCGYTIQNLVRDRTIVSCVDWGRWDEEFVGFCLVAAPE